MALQEGQYQIGSVVFGRGTSYHVADMQIDGYSVNSQDFQVTNTDEMRFGQDTFAPAPLVFTMSVLNNRLLDSAAQHADPMGLVNIPSGKTLLERLQREWRGDDVRHLWNAQKPLRLNSRGTRYLVYGRPRKFTQGYPTRKSEWIDVVCDFQRADTAWYSEEEYGHQIGVAGTTLADITTQASIARSWGEADSWIRFIVQGPVHNPVIRWGSQHLEINATIGSSEIMEVSSYPWDRRIVRSDGANLSAAMIGVSPYLDQLRFQAGSTKALGLAGTGTDSNTKLYVLWREAHLTV